MCRCISIYMFNLNRLKHLICRLPFVGPVLLSARRGRHLFLRHAPGHFYSPLPAENWREQAIPSEKGLLPGLDGVDLNVQGQLELLAALGSHAAGYPFQAKAVAPFRYGYENDYFPRTDGAMLYAMLRQFRPATVVEVGSGHSSALMLDCNELFFEGRLNLTFIEPYPQRLLGLLSDKEQQAIQLQRCRVQEIDPALFESLRANDILFIDSSHVSKYGSDVNHLFFHILPRLQPGVLVHVHDIPYPFEYPDEWFDEGRAWNEAYLLRAFLQYNRAFEIVLWPSFLGRAHSGVFGKAWPELEPGTGFSIWLRKKAS